VKTSLDIANEIFRHTKARAALRGVSLGLFVAEALDKKIRANDFWIAAQTIKDRLPILSKGGHFDHCPA
jgi:predicted nucleic acid-binding protein